MSSELFVIIVLLVYILVKEVFYYTQLQKLVNKLMSRSYFEYEQAEAINAPPPKEKEIKINLKEYEEREDLGRIF